MIISNKKKINKIYTIGQKKINKKCFKKNNAKVYVKFIYYHTFIYSPSNYIKIKHYLMKSTKVHNPNYY